MEWRGGISPGGSQLLARARLSDPRLRWPAHWERPGLSLIPRPTRWCLAGHEEEALSGLPVAALRLPSVAPGATGSPWPVDDWRRPSTAARDAGQPVWRDLAAAAGPGPGPAARDLRLRAAQGAALGSSASGKCRLTIALPSISFAGRLLRELLSMADRHGMGLQELEGEIRTETDLVKIEIRLVEPTRDERHLAQLAELQLERRTWSGGVVAVRWAALGWGGWSKLRAVGSAMMSNRKPPGRLTPWSSDSAAAWRQGPCCESSSFPTHSLSTWSGSSRGRAPNRPETDALHVTPGTVSRPSLPTLGQSSAD